MISFLCKSFSCFVIWNIFGGVAGMGTEQEPDCMYKMQCNVPSNKHFRIAVIAQRYIDIANNNYTELILYVFLSPSEFYRNNMRICLHWQPKMIRVVWGVAVQVDAVGSHRQPKRKQIAQIVATRKIQSPFTIPAMNRVRYGSNIFFCFCHIYMI